MTTESNMSESGTNRSTGRSAGWIVAGAWCIAALSVAIGLPWIARLEMTRVGLIAESLLEEAEIHDDERFRQLIIAQGEVHSQLAHFQRSLEESATREAEAEKQVARLESELADRDQRLNDLKKHMLRLQAKVAQENLVESGAVPAPKAGESSEDETKVGEPAEAEKVGTEALASNGGAAEAEPASEIDTEVFRNSALEALIASLPEDQQAAAMAELLGRGSADDGARSEAKARAERARSSLNRLLADAGALFRLLQVTSVEDGVLHGVSVSLMDRDGNLIGSVLAEDCYVTLEEEKRIADFRLEKGTILEGAERKPIDPFHWIRVVDVAPAEWLALGPDFSKVIEGEAIAQAKDPKDDEAALPLMVAGEHGATFSKINRWLQGKGDRLHYQFRTVESTGAEALETVTLVRRSPAGSVKQTIDAKRCEAWLLPGEDMVQLDLFEGRIVSEDGKSQDIPPTGYSLFLTDIVEADWQSLDVPWLKLPESSGN